jgi:hypothetical protein
MDRLGLDIFAAVPARVAVVAQLAHEGFAGPIPLRTVALFQPPP